MRIRSLFVDLSSQIKSSQINRPGTRRDRQTAGHHGEARRLFLESLEDRNLLAFNVLGQTATASDTRAFVLAPIDAGSQLDLVTIENGRVAIRLGNPDGSFGSPLASLGEIVASNVLAADFTNDGVADLVTGYDQVSLRIGNGNGTFQSPQSFSLPAQPEVDITGFPRLYGQGASSLATGDLNADGKLDLVVGGITRFRSGIACGYYGGCSYQYSHSAYVNVLIGNGTGSFQYADDDPSTPELNAHSLGTGGPGAIAVADLNHDQRADVLASRNTLLGDGGGDLQSPIYSRIGEDSLASISLGDVDGDGNLDTISRSGNSLVVKKGQGDGSFVEGAIADTGIQLHSAVIGDVNADGKLDLIAVGQAPCSDYGCYDLTKQASVLLGNGQGAFSLPIVSSLQTGPASNSYLPDAALADLTGDGRAELVTIDDRYFDGAAIVAANDGQWVTPIELSISDATVVEGNDGTASAVFTVTRSTDAGGPASVDYATADYYASYLFGPEGGVDYSPQSGTLAFGPGVLSQTITVPVLGDRLAEGNETFYVNLSNLTGAQFRRSQGQGLILDDEPSISIDHPYGREALTVVEGDTGSTPAVFTVSLSRPYDQDVTVHYYTLSGHTNDIVSADATLRFAPGETSQQITVQVLGDLQHEGLEAFDVYLDNPSPNALIDQQEGYCYIEDNDPLPTVSIGDVSKSEGNSGTTKFNFTLTLSAPTTGGYVQFAMADGTATTANHDYTARSGYVYFGDGQTTQTISIDVTGDRTTEADETFFVNLISAGGATIADGQGVGAILNDDRGTTPPQPSISIGDAQITEGNSGTKLLSFTVSLSAVSSQTVQVNYATANGSAKTSDNDYVSSSGTIIFSPGQITKTITVTIKGDGTKETDEKFYVNLSGASNAVIGDGQGVGTILNDDNSSTPGKAKPGHQALFAAAVDVAIDDWMVWGPKKRGW